MNDEPSITISGDILLNLIDDLIEWEEIATGQYHMPEGWKRSPALRENRRESVVYGNCASTIKTALGRHYVNELMAQARARKADAQARQEAGKS